MASSPGPEPVRRTEVSVVGAGLAGLACALRLQQCGVEVEVLERAGAPGGRVRTDLVQGYRLDRGFQLLNPYYPEARRVLDLAALRLQPFPNAVVAVSGGQRHLLADPRRAGLRGLAPSLWSAVRAPGGPLEKLALARWGVGVQRARVGDLLLRPDLPWREVADQFGLRGRLRAGVLETFLAGTLGEADGASSRRYVELLIRAFLRGTPGLPHEGMQAMPDQLAARLTPGTVRLSVGVEHLEPAPDGSGHLIQHSDGTSTARAVVVAADPPTAARLTGITPVPMRSLTTYWHFADHAPTTSAALHLDADRSGPVLNTAVVSNAAPSYCPGSGGALIASTTLESDPGALAVGAVGEQLGRIYSCDTRAWRLLRTDVIPHALPSMAPPFQPRRPVELAGGLFVAGDHRDTASIQGALVSGRRAADAVLARLGHPVPARPAMTR